MSWALAFTIVASIAVIFGFLGWLIYLEQRYAGRKDKSEDEWSID